MKVLILSQYFWPENFKINDLAIELSKKMTLKFLLEFQIIHLAKSTKIFKSTKKIFKI